MKTALLMVLGVSACTSAFAQLTLNGQLRTRTEVRDGQGAPLPKGAKPAFFTSQRTRVSLGYSTYRLKFGITAQDVRVWGQDVSTVNRTTTQDNNALMLHEAWAEIGLTDTTVKNKSLSLKLGRQELVYDNERLLGNLDWAQQGRRHDAALLKFETPVWMLHLAAAFNQNKENTSGTLYNNTPAGNYTAGTNGSAMYKSMAFLYAGRKLQHGNISFLFLTDAFSKYHSDSVSASPAKVFESGAWTRMTTGLYASNTFNKLQVTASAYYQFGKSSSGQKISAGLLSAAVQYNFCKAFSAGPGVDYTSGGSNGAVTHSFDPLYGTPHKFWGLMDYFYVANGFGKSGLADYYLKSRFKASEKFQVAADVHQFFSAAAIPGNGTSQKNFGAEADVVATASITRQVTLEGGYGHFFSTPLLTSANVKNIPNAKLNSNWFYVMINIKPNFLFK